MADEEPSTSGRTSRPTRKGRTMEKSPATTRGKGKQKAVSRSEQWDANNPNNWDISLLKTKLLDLKINVPKTVTKKMLVLLYQANVPAANSSDAGAEIPAEEPFHTFDLSAIHSAESRPSTSRPDNVIPSLDVLATDIRQSATVGSLPVIPDFASAIPANTRAVPSPDVTTLRNEMSELRDMISGIQQSVFALTTVNVNNGQATSTTTQPSSEITGGLGLSMLSGTSNSVAPDTLPHIASVSDSMRKQITEGKLVNLAALLIPHNEAPDSRTTEFDGQIFKIKEDPRLNKILTLGEFIAAFGVYKTVLCEAYPNRRSELDTCIRTTHSRHGHAIWGFDFLRLSQVICIQSCIMATERGSGELGLSRH